jgi:hypothetical protein
MPDLALVCIGCAFVGIVGKVLFEEGSLVVWGGEGGFIVSDKDVDGVVLVVMVGSDRVCMVCWL